ncbi:MAG: hypothetical protein ALECFALPRED_005868 [Alectoria fallacina]|uniref:Bulb-type lectin domain-containing protein n=1 Tax=Alectoria fallacina TaxID=1903189 RepID=A0A8H3G6R0_9LECA|nr:MAG: hypothetical protein ALECFALPRED_005868 [Alectoria fallacina]
MWFPTAVLSILTLAAASPMGSLQRRANKEVLFGTQQAFTLKPSNSPVVSLWGGVDTYFQGDGNFVVYNGGAIWSSGTAGHNCETTDTCLLAWQGDGNLVIYINGAALWSSGTAKRGELLTFTAQSYAIEITGVESEGSAPILWRTPETGNEPDPGPGGPSFLLSEVEEAEWIRGWGQDVVKMDDGTEWDESSRWDAR